MMPKRRTILKLVTFLLLGAAVNVAVAWWCAQSPRWDTRLQIARKTVPSRAQLFDGSRIPYFDSGGFGCEFSGQPGPDRWRQMLVVYSVGFPCRSFASWSRTEDGEHWIDTDIHIPLSDTSYDQCRITHELPLIPIFPGFAINTMFYAALSWPFIALPLAWRGRRRAERSLCPACAYPVGTNTVCTECGKPVETRPVRGDGASRVG